MRQHRDDPAIESAPSRPDEFGPRLRRLRKAAGLSQGQLAGDYVHSSYLSLLETGQRLPSPDVLAVLAGRLGVSVAELSGQVDRDLEAPVALAEAALGLGRPAAAVDLLEPHLDRMVPERFITDALAVRAAETLASAFERVGRLDAALGLLEGLAAAQRRTPGRWPSMAVSVALVRCYRDSGDLQRSIDVGEAVVARLDGLTTTDLEGSADLVSTLASAYLERGDLARASLLLDDVVARTTQTGSIADRAPALWNAAITAVERGRPADGLLLAEQAAQLVAHSGNLRSRARIQVTQAWVLLAQTPPRPEPARDLLRDALPQLRQYANQLSVCSAQTELARCEVLLGRPAVAVRHARSALSHLTQEQPLERARALAVLAAGLLGDGDTAAGVVCLDEAASLLDRSTARRQAGSVWRQLSDVYRQLGNLDRALGAADRALNALGAPAEPISAKAVTSTAPQLSMSEHPVA